MKNMKRTFFAAIGLVAMVGLAIGATAQAGDNVAATVTIGTVSVTVDHATFDYGTMPYSNSKETFSFLTSNKNIGATVGTVPTDLVIVGSAAAATTPWTLAGSPGADTYEHQFSAAANGITQPASYVALTMTNQSLATNVSANAVSYFGLKIFTPVSGNAAQHTATVTLTASWHQ